MSKSQKKWLNLLGPQNLADIQENNIYTFESLMHVPLKSKMKFYSSALQLKCKLKTKANITFLYIKL